MKSVSASRPYSYSWHILNTFFPLRSPILSHPNKHQYLRANLHLTCNQYELFYRPTSTSNIDLCPVFISRKVGEDLKHRVIKPALINEQSVVYKFECDRCDASYVGYTRRHLSQRIDEHKRSGSIFNHSQSQHQSTTITSNMFRILKKCSGKFDCLLYEMFLIREHKPCINIQSDTIKAKLFT